MVTAPSFKPSHPFFGSGPCAKPKSWNPAIYKNAVLARSHRSTTALKKLREVVQLTHSILEIPNDYKLAIVPGSATGAMEILFLNLLGIKPITIFTHDAFSYRWEIDITERLNLDCAEIRRADFGFLPDTSQINSKSDIVINLNGSTSGVKYPDLDFISPNHDGLVIADITSAAFTTDLPWHKIDAAGFSWQKGLGGEGAHGMVALSPKAIDRLQKNTPKLEAPYLLEIANKNGFIESIFEEKTINTPSMLCVEDFLFCLKWALDSGGAQWLTEKSKENLLVIKKWIKKNDWLAFSAKHENYLSSSTIVFEITEKRYQNLHLSEKKHFNQKIADFMESNQIAFDILNHPFSPPSFRIWGGATIDKLDLEILTKWFEWAYHVTLKEL